MAHTINPPSSNSPSLSTLAQKLELLKQNLALGNTNLLEQDLRWIFDQLKSQITSKTLVEGLIILENSTLLLAEKIDALNRYIHNLNRGEIIWNYLNSGISDDNLISLFIPCWHSPLYFPTLSLDTIFKYWQQLRWRVPSTGTDPSKREFLDHSFIEQSIESNDNPFDQRMMQFYQLIINRLPANLTDLLHDDVDPLLYYEHFVIILHLLKNGYLHYDKEKGILERVNEK